MCLTLLNQHVQKVKLNRMKGLKLVYSGRRVTWEVELLNHFPFTSFLFLMSRSSTTQPRTVLVHCSSASLPAGAVKSSRPLSRLQPGTEAQGGRQSSNYTKKSQGETFLNAETDSYHNPSSHVKGWN